MKTVVTGASATITNKSDLAVLAEIVSRIDFMQLLVNPEYGELTITREQFEGFIARAGSSLQEVGLLDEEMVATGLFSEQE